MSPAILTFMTEHKTNQSTLRGGGGSPSLAIRRTAHLPRGRCKIWSLLAIVIAVILVAASCGSGGDSDDSSDGDSRNTEEVVGQGRSADTAATVPSGQGTSSEDAPQEAAATTIESVMTLAPATMLPVAPPVPQTLAVQPPATLPPTTSPPTTISPSTTTTTTTTTLPPPPPTLPSWIDPNTEELDLSEQNLTELPDWIGNLTNLKSLYLQGNKLSSIPEEIGNLTSLEYLDIGCGSGDEESVKKEHREEYTFRIFYYNYYDCNQVTELPSSIGNMVNLKHLYLEGNPLTELPEEIGNLSSLETLYLGLEGRRHSNLQRRGVSLRTFPDSIGNLQQLRILSAPYGELRDLPETIGNLTNLEELYLHDNELVSIPETLTQLTSLRKFTLDGTFLSGYTYSDIDNIAFSELSGNLQVFLSVCCQADS